MNEDNLNKFRLRRNIFGKLILQVLIIENHIGDIYGSGYLDEWTTSKWKDAKLSDIEAGSIINNLGVV